MNLHKELHSLNEGIPSGNDTHNHVGMDTLNNREGIHLWIGHHKSVKIKGKSESVFESQSVHLTREDAQNLIEEIRHRLF